MSAGTNAPMCKARTTPLCPAAPRGLDSLRQGLAAKHPAPGAHPSPGRGGPAVGIACGEGAPWTCLYRAAAALVGADKRAQPATKRQRSRPPDAGGRPCDPAGGRGAERDLADRVGPDPGRRGRTRGALHRAVSSAGQAPAGSTLPQYGGRSYTPRRKSCPARSFSLRDPPPPWGAKPRRPLSQC